MGRELQSRLWLLPRSRGLFSRRTEINGFRLQVLRTQGLQASINATASISSNLDKAFPFNTNHGKSLISVLLLNKPHGQLEVLAEQLARESGEFVDRPVAFANLRQATGLNCCKRLVFCHSRRRRS